MDEVDSIPENTRKVRVHVASHYAVHRRETRCFDQLCSRCGRSLRVIGEDAAARVGENDLIGQLGIAGGSFVVVDSSAWYSMERRELRMDEEFCS